MVIGASTRPIVRMRIIIDVDEPAYLIRYHLATNPRSIAVARILGCDRIGNPERHPNGMM